MDEALVSVDEAVDAIRPLSNAKATSWPKLLYHWMGEEGSGRPLVDRLHGSTKLPTTTPRITRQSLELFLLDYPPRGARRKRAWRNPSANNEKTTQQTNSQDDGATDVHELVIRLSMADAKLFEAETIREIEQEEILDKLKALEVASTELKYENEKLRARLQRRNERMELFNDRRELLEKIVRDRLGHQHP